MKVLKNSKLFMQSQWGQQQHLQHVGHMADGRQADGASEIHPIRQSQSRLAGLSSSGSTQAVLNLIQS